MVQFRKEQIILLRAYWSSIVYAGNSGASSTNIAAATLNAASITATSGGDADNTNPVRGIVTETPYNLVTLRDADTGFSILDGSSRVIFGRITFSSGNYVVSYLALSDTGVDGTAGTEVSTTLASNVDIEMLFPEVMQIEEVPVSASLTPWNNGPFGGVGVGGGESLAETLLIGNQTHADGDTPVSIIIGLNSSLILKSGAVIESSGSVVTIDDDLSVSGSLALQDEITGADYITFTQQISSPGVNDTLWVDNSGDIFFRKSGVDYSLFGSVETLAQTLAAGNNTGGTEIVVDNTDWIETGSAPSTSGVLRVSAGQQITSRNVANSGNRTMLYVNASNEVQLGDTVAGTRISTGGTDGYVYIGSSIEEFVRFMPHASIIEFDKDISESIAQIRVEDTNTTGKGLSIYSGNTTSASASAGDLTLVAGSASNSSGNGGKVIIEGGDSDSGDGGDIQNYCGSGSGGNGFWTVRSGSSFMSLSDYGRSTGEAELDGALQVIGNYNASGDTNLNSTWNPHSFGFRGPSHGTGQLYNTALAVSFRGPLITPSPAFVDTSFPAGGDGVLLTVDADNLNDIDEWGLVAIFSDGTCTTIAPVETSGSTNGTIVD